MPRVAITGGSGFIGCNLVESLRNSGYEVLNLDTRPPRNPAAQSALQRLDILNRQEFVNAVSSFNPHYMFHLAARTDLNGRTEDDYSANIQGTSNAVAAAASCPALKRAIFASSMYVCKVGYIPRGDEEYCPHTAYGKSKVLGEQIVRKELGDKRCWAIVRPTSIWGPWFGIPYISFFHVVRKGMYFHPSGYRIRRSYGFVLNTIQQLKQLMECEDDGNVHGRMFYLADYEPTDSRVWAETIANSFGNCRIHDAPLMLMKMMARLGDALSRMGADSFPLTTFRLNNMLTDAVFDLSPIRKIAGAHPYNLQDGVTLTVDWMRRYVLNEARRSAQKNDPTLPI